MENIVEEIMKYCEEQDYEFSNNYSGRFMYGKECVGIFCDQPLTVIVELFSYLLDNDFDQWTVNDYLHDAKEDSLGTRRVLYFPNIRSE